MVGVPQWATSGVAISVNGQSEAGPLTPASFHTLMHRMWNDGDSVILDFPMPTTTTEQINGSVSIHRGPLVYALKIGESWKKTTANTVDGIDFGEYEVTPTTPWSYALRIDATTVAASFNLSGVRPTRRAGLNSGLAARPAEMLAFCGS